MQVSRALFERTIEKLVEEAEKPCFAAIRDTKVRGVLLVSSAYIFLAKCLAVYHVDLDTINNNCPLGWGW